jgi:hypothetical protein
MPGVADIQSETQELTIEKIKTFLIFEFQIIIIFFEKT